MASKIHLNKNRIVATCLFQKLSTHLSKLSIHLFLKVKLAIYKFGKATPHPVRK